MMEAPKSDPATRCIVRKYGGSSLATVERVRAVARDISELRARGQSVVVVVSAMGSTTDELNDLATQAHSEPPRRELDMLLSVGERITMSLLSMALHGHQCPAISFTGSQCGIITDNSHTDARILEVRGDRVREALERGYVVVVAGFQGVSREREITTLGRGGSDTTAVALAAALGADRCEILKDVDGVMEADPGKVGAARLIKHLNWDQMLEIAATGCGVVHLRAVEYAARHGVRLVVRSSFHDGPGTVIDDARDRGPEEPAQTAPPSPPWNPSDPVADRENRYRPLVMNLTDDVTRLRLTTEDKALGIQLRQMALRRLDPARTIGEWLDAGRGFRWEVLAPRAALTGLLEDLEAFGDREDVVRDVEENLTCISLAGGRPDSWLEVERHLTDVLTGLGCDRWRMRADGTALRLLLSGDPARDLAEQLHRILIPS